jgi:hypothetical protein
VVFTAGDLPGGSADVNYSWHLATGGTASESPITLKSGSSQTSTYQERSNGTTGDVYVTWSADGISRDSNSVSVTITCIK